MSAAALAARRQADRTAVAGKATALLLAGITPLSENRRVRFSGVATAAEIRVRGIWRAVTSPAIPACTRCGRRARRLAAHGPQCHRVAL